MVEEASRESQGAQEIEATGDAILIADSIRESGERIAAGLIALARAVERTIDPEPEQGPQDYYMDGKPIR